MTWISLIKHSCYASELPAFSWFSCPNCWRIVLTELYEWLNYFIKKSTTIMTKTFHRAEMNKWRKPPIFMIYFISYNLFFSGQNKKTRKNSWLDSWLTRGWLVTWRWLGLALGSCNATKSLGHTVCSNIVMRSLWSLQLTKRNEFSHDIERWYRWPA